MVMHDQNQKIFAFAQPQPQLNINLKLIIAIHTHAVHTPTSLSFIFIIIISFKKEVLIENEEGKINCGIPTSFTGFTITFTYFYLMPTGSWIKNFN
jgi:uncharacterized membrane protein (DUF485 family)